MRGLLSLTYLMQLVQDMPMRICTTAFYAVVFWRPCAWARRNIFAMQFLAALTFSVLTSPLYFLLICVRAVDSYNLSLTGVTGAPTAPYPCRWLRREGRRRVALCVSRALKAEQRPLAPLSSPVAQPVRRPLRVGRLAEGK